MNKVFLGLGTNIGDRRANLGQALKQIKNTGCLNLIKLSSVYETKPIGVAEQKWFYNMVVKAQTNKLPEKLLFLVKEIEKKMGRKTSMRWGPRLIDIDLLLYNGLSIKKRLNSNTELKLPHPEIKNRAFVIIPLLEIEPEAKLPGGFHISNFLEYTKEQEIKKIGTLF